MAGLVSFQHAKGAKCRDSRHRSCAGKWRGEVRDGSYRRRVDGATKCEVQDKLDDIERELGLGIKASATCTVEQAVADWIDNQGKLAAKTIQTKKELLGPLLGEIGTAKLRDLTVSAVDVVVAGRCPSLPRIRATWHGRSSVPDLRQSNGTRVVNLTGGLGVTSTGKETDPYDCLT